MGLRLSAAATSDDPVRGRDAGLLLGRARGGPGRGGGKPADPALPERRHRRHPAASGHDRRRGARRGVAFAPRRLPERSAGTAGALVLHADDARFLAPPGGGLHRLRLHGRARQLPLRAARADRAGARAARRRRRRLHRRLQPLRGQARPSRQHPPVSVKRGSRPFRRGARGSAGSCRPAGARPAALRLLRGGRRADGPGAARGGRRRAAGLVDRHRRPGGEDRSRRSAAAAEHLLPGRQDV